MIVERARSWIWYAFTLALIPGIGYFTQTDADILVVFVMISAVTSHLVVLQDSSYYRHGPLVFGGSLLYMYAAGLISAYAPAVLLQTEPLGRMGVFVGLIVLPLIALCGYFWINRPAKPTKNDGSWRNCHLVFVWLVASTLGTYTSINNVLFVLSSLVVVPILLAMVWDQDEQMAFTVVLGGFCCYVLMGLVFFMAYTPLQHQVNQILKIVLTIITLFALGAREVNRERYIDRPC